MALIHQCIRGRLSFLLLLAIVLILVDHNRIAAMRQQAVAVKGLLLCGGRPASGVKVKLWDEDDGPDPDDVLDEVLHLMAQFMEMPYFQGYTDGGGAFSLRGSTRKHNWEPNCAIS